MQHTGECDDGHMLSWAFHLAAIERDGVFDAFIRHVAFHVVKQFVFDEKHRVGVAHGGFEYPFDIVRGGGCDYF